jgi:hypothetical protein
MFIPVNNYIQEENKINRKYPWNLFILFNSSLKFLDNINKMFNNKIYNLKEENLLEQENFTDFFEEYYTKKDIFNQQYNLTEIIKQNYPNQEGNLNIVEAVFSTFIDGEFPQTRKSTLQKFNEIGNRYSFTENESPYFNNIINNPKTEISIGNSDKNKEEKDIINIDDKLDNREIIYPHFNQEEKKPEIIELDPEIKKENDFVHLLMNQKVSEFDLFLNRNEWKVLEETKDGYKAFYIDEKSGLRSIKSNIVIEKNINFLVEYLDDLDKRGKYDVNFDYGKVLRIIDESHSIRHLKFKGKFMISPRDFIVCGKINKVFIIYS